MVVHYWDGMVFFLGTFLPIVYGDWVFSLLGFQKKEKGKRIQGLLWGYFLQITFIQNKFK